LVTITIKKKKPPIVKTPKSNLARFSIQPLFNLTISAKQICEVLNSPKSQLHLLFVPNQSRLNEPSAPSTALPQIVCFLFPCTGRVAITNPNRDWDRRKTQSFPRIVKILYSSLLTSKSYELMKRLVFLFLFSGCLIVLLVLVHKAWTGCCGLLLTFFPIISVRPSVWSRREILGLL